jgi:hypothetical protein
MVCNVCNQKRATKEIKTCDNCFKLLSSTINRHHAIRNELNSLRNEIDFLRKLLVDLMENQRYKMIMVKKEDVELGSARSDSFELAKEEDNSD